MTGKVTPEELRPFREGAKQAGIGSLSEGVWEENIQTAFKEIDQDGDGGECMDAMGSNELRTDVITACYSCVGLQPLRPLNCVNAWRTISGCHRTHL